MCDGIDNDCDSFIDEALTAPCGTTAGVCVMGMAACVDGAWSEICEGSVAPTEETCDPEGLDEDCDGTENENCPCVAGETQDCGTSDGICELGTQTCSAEGQWSTECEGEVTAQSAEKCDAERLDENCDGEFNEGCECSEGEEETCDGNSMGECKPGTRKCANGRWGMCQGKVAPVSRETCNGKDDDCDGEEDNGATCGGGMKCAAGKCTDWCTDEECEGNGNVCQTQVCSAITGKCEAGPAAESDTPCTDGNAVKVGYCDGGTCRADNEIVCTVGNQETTQIMFTTQRYFAAGPGNVNSPSSTIGPCKTRRSGQLIVWDVFRDGGNNSGTRTEVLNGFAKEAVCGGGTCAKWFGNPRTANGNVPVECFIFDDGNASRVGPTRQFTPWFEGTDHPSVVNSTTDNRRAHATLCTPEQCRKWIGDCRVR